MSFASVDLYWLPLEAGGAVRRWRGGTIPDIAEAVASPRRLSTDVSYASSGHRVEAIESPAHGRAPGWSAGLVVATRHLRQGAGGRHGVA